MKKSTISLLLSTLFTASLLVGCGEEAPPVQIAGYNNQQVQQAPAATTPKTTTAKTATTAKTTTAKTPATTATTAKTTTATTTAATAKTPATTATTTATATSNLSAAQKIIQKAKQTYDGLNSYTATITMFSKRNDKTSKDANPILNAETKYTFQAPRNGIFNVVKHNLSMVVGAKMVWKGGQTAKVKAGGVLGLFPLDLALTDSKMTTNREWRLDQLDHVGILSRALDPKAELTLAGKSTINGKEAYMVKVKGTGIDDGVTEENIAIDIKDFTILADEMYGGQELLFQTKITIETKNVPIAPADFEV